MPRTHWSYQNSVLSSSISTTSSSNVSTDTEYDIWSDEETLLMINLREMAFVPDVTEVSETILTQPRQTVDLNFQLIEPGYTDDDWNGWCAYAAKSALSFPDCAILCTVSPRWKVCKLSRDDYLHALREFFVFDVPLFSERFAWDSMRRGRALPVRTGNLWYVPNSCLNQFNTKIVF